MTTRRFTQLDDVWPAGIGRRLGAMLYDGFLVMAIWIAVTVAHLAFFRFVLGQTAEEIGTTAFDIWSLRLMLLFFVTLFFVYSLAAFGIGYWWVLFDGQRRSWPDIASKTETVVLPKK